MTGWTLCALWPVRSPVIPHEAIAEALARLPGFAEQAQATLVGQPRARLVTAVLVEVPAIKRRAAS